MSDFAINPGEITSSYGGNTESAKPAAARELAPKVNSQEILKEELAKTLAKIDADTAAAASTTDPKYRQELMARIERAKQDLPGLQREIARAGGAPAPAADAASAPASGAAPGFVIDPKVLTDSYDGKDKAEQPLSNTQIAAGAGAAAGAYYGARKPLNTADNSLAARLMERQYGLPTGSLAAFEGALTPSMPTPAEASLAAARSITPSTPAPVSAPTVENPLSAMEKWAASQVGKESVLPANVISQATSNYANDPTGAPQIIQQQAANTRLARQLAPPSSMQTSAGGIPYVESPQEQRARIIAEENARRQAAIETGLNQPVGAVPTPAQQQQQTVENTAAKIRAASARAHALQRGANVVVRGAFGAPLVAQAYGMATQEEPLDWQQWLSLGGNALGTFGPLTSKVPFLGRIPVAGPLATLAQLPYAVKNREALFRALQKGDVMPPGIVTGTEASESAFPFSNLDRP